MNETLPACDPGYRYLNKGEIVQEGDECVSTYCLIRGGDSFGSVSVSIGVAVGTEYTDLTFRRKVEVKPDHVLVPVGWRLLTDGETVKKGDLYLNNRHQTYWEVVDSSAGGIVGTNTATQYKYCTPEEVKPIEKPVKKPSKKRIRPGKGYRMLKIGETIQDKDQYFDTIAKGWRDTSFQGYKIEKTSDKYRRKVGEVTTEPPVAKPVEPAVKPNFAPNGVDLGQGYRLVLESEGIQDGDETWGEFYSRWDKCGQHSWDSLKSKWPGETIRRKVEEAKDEIKGDTDNSSTARWVYEKLKDLLGIEENNVYVNVERLVNENKALKEKLAKVLDIVKT
jgi:hypothetical protein